MDNPNLGRKLFFATAGGLAGFFVILLAVGIVLVAAFQAGGLIFGGGIHSWQDHLFIAILVPTLISLGAAMPAWGLGAKWWHGLLTGIIAMIVFIYIELDGGKQVNYAPFSQRETLAYVSTALVSVLIATIGKNKFYPSKFVLLITLVVALAILRFIVPEENYVLGFVGSLLVWILSPLAAAFFTIPEQNGEVHVTI